MRFLRIGASRKQRPSGPGDITFNRVFCAERPDGVEVEVEILSTVFVLAPIEQKSRQEWRSIHRIRAP